MSVGYAVLFKYKDNIFFQMMARFLPL